MPCLARPGHARIRESIAVVFFLINTHLKSAVLDIVLMRMLHDGNKVLQLFYKGLSIRHMLHYLAVGIIQKHFCVVAARG